jgi:hypothetical protein
MDEETERVQLRNSRLKEQLELLDN